MLNLKRRAIKKIIVTTFVLFILLTIYLIPSNNKEENNYKYINIQDISVYLLNKNDQLTKVDFKIKDDTKENTIKAIIKKLTISNDGKMLRPHIVEKIENSNTGEITYERQIEESEQLVSDTTLKKIKEFEDAGYDVDGAFMELTRDLSTERSLARSELSRCVQDNKSEQNLCRLCMYHDYDGDDEVYQCTDDDCNPLLINSIIFIIKFSLSADFSLA